eukprot:5092654-Heterocapsa_arctica.AAC.1
MNKSLLKEWSTWTKYAAADIIPAAKSKNIDPTLILDTRIVWTDKAIEVDGFEPKCRMIGKGFQEVYDDKLRRGSPTSSPQM